MSGLAGLYLPRHVARSHVLVTGLAGGSALAGLLAQPAATGLGAYDAVLRAALCGVTVLLVARGGTRSRRRRVVARWLLVAAAAIALAAAGSSSAWMAGGGLGLLVGAASARLNAPVLRAVAAGLTSQAALRLDRPGFALGTALVAAAVFVLLGAGGFTGLRRRARTPYVKVAITATGMAVVLSALGAWAVYRARTSVNDGVASALAAVSQARLGDVTGSAGLFDQGARSFSDASGRLNSWWARPATVVPLVGRNGRALTAMADSGSALSAAGARAAREGDVTGLRLAGGAVPLDRIVALQGPARDASSSLAAADQRLAEVRSPWLVPPVSSRLEDLSVRVRQVRRDVEVARAASEVAPAMLGADRPRRYFLALQTPSEARGSGGFIGNFGEISAEKGRLRLERLGRSGELNAAANERTGQIVAPPDYMARYSRFSTRPRAWQNINMSPDFPSVAQAISSLYPQSGGRPVDGVIAIDPLGLAALLKVVGPVQVKEWPVPISADNAASILLFEQYVRFPGDDRVDFLSRVTDAVWQRLTTSGADVVQLAQTLSPMVAEKHVQVASTDPGEERNLEQLGVAGRMAPVRGDFLAVVTGNAAGNKIDWFLRRAVDYRVRFDPASGQVRSTARVTLRNQAPAGGLPDYLIGSSTTPPLPRGTNKLYLSVYSPLRLTGARTDGRAAFFESELERDRHVYSTYVTIPPGSTSTVEVDLEGQVQGPDGNGYRLDLHRQPFLAPDAVTASLELADDRRAGRGKSKASEQRRLELVADRRLAWP